MKEYFWLIQFLFSIVLAPLLPGIISRVKAIFAGRHGKPLLQGYFDLWRLMRKGEILCQGWPFVLAPAIVAASSILALAFLPLGGQTSPLGFAGDFIFAAYLLGMGRFALMLGALATGSAFEGMGASREAAFSALAEPALFLAFLIFSSFCIDMGHFSTADTGSAFSLNSMLKGQLVLAWHYGKAPLFIAPIVLFILLLAENCRIPVDDPTTHLELTMIHEVMILDQSGPNLAFMQYGASLKLWFFASLLASLTIPPMDFLPATLLWLGQIAVIGVLVGLVESLMARLRLVRVPHLLGMASALAALALILTQVS